LGKYPYKKWDKANTERGAGEKAHEAESESQLKGQGQAKGWAKKPCKLRLTFPSWSGTSSPKNQDPVIKASRRERQNGRDGEEGLNVT